MVSRTAIIREAIPDDLPRLLDLYLQLSEQSEQPEQETRTLTSEHLNVLQRMTAAKDVHLFVVEDEGMVLGTLVLYLMPNLSHGGRPFAIVENVVVDRSARSTGYGRLLMQHAEQLAGDAGCYKVALTSNRKRSAAHAFYERIGYHPTHVGFTKYTSQNAH